jgi:hypothetical protein
MSLRGLIFAVVCVGVLGCVNEIEPEVGALTAGVCKSDDSDPDNEVSFEQTILPHLQMGCTCHNPMGSGVSIDSTMFAVANYASVRRGGANSHEKIVIDGDPCNSIIYQKLSSGPPFGSRMPISGPYWSRSDLLLLHDWIAEGAHDD